MKKVLAIIPARGGSTRLPGKPLLNLTGKSLVQHVYENAVKCKKLDRIIVATDDELIASTVSSFGGEAIMTSPDHESGSDRIAEVAERLAEFDLIINMQGDEPELEPSHVDFLVELLLTTDADVTTLACPFSQKTLSGPGSPLDPACVKVVLGKAYDNQQSARRALYFSRSLVPYPRADNGAMTDPTKFFMHIGVYGYRRDSLLAYTNLPKSFLESQEKLEQLRALENDFSIAVGLVDHSSPGIDTQEDYDNFVQRYTKGL